ATSTQTSLTKEQKQAVGLLSIGTFLEYFDLMLYVHMAVLLNELFFPKTDPSIQTILAAFAFCSTYALRPFGALIFGYIGDNYGRKPTFILTTLIMAICCCGIVILPTYNQIGISAAIIVSILRIVQGMSSMGEIMGAKIYLSEITKPPSQYALVSSIAIASSVGSMAALAVASITLKTNFNWRYAFAFGMVIALIGTAARSKLHETPEFANAKQRLKNMLEKVQEYGYKGDINKIMSGPVLHKKIPLKDFFNFFCIYCGWPLSFYLIYIYFTPILKTSCGYTSEDVIFHNLIVSIVQIFVAIGLTVLSTRIYPLLILKISSVCFFFILVLIPIIANTNLNNYKIFAIQTLLTVFCLKSVPADAIFIKYFPVFKRFTAVTFGYALSRAIMYILISFGLVYLTEWFGYYGIWVIAFPVTFFWTKSVYYYESLDRDKTT
ncbi:MAG: MFS transporter, partial [Rickettsiaceae bacterium]